jgi:SAM-dependent methyltransferase
MLRTEIIDHWTKQATENKLHWKATTKTHTIKALEINALYKAFQKAHLRQAEVLEVGCGNGYNLLELSELMPYNFTGIDYIPEMINYANILKGDKKITYEHRELFNLEKSYDIIFTDRCLINLGTKRSQQDAFDHLASKVNPGGSLIILENFVKGHEKQNECRRVLGMKPREVAPYNLFLDDDFLEHAKEKMNLVHEDDFGGLHDLITYVLTDADYKCPMIESATKLSIGIGNALKDYGQNRLYMFKQKEV